MLCPSQDPADAKLTINCIAASRRWEFVPFSNTITRFVIIFIILLIGSVYQYHCECHLCCYHHSHHRCCHYCGNPVLFVGTEIPTSAPYRTHVSALRLLSDDHYLLERPLPRARLERPLLRPSAPPTEPLPPASAARHAYSSSQRRQLSEQLLSARLAEQRAGPVAL